MLPDIKGKKRKSLLVLLAIFLFLFNFVDT